MALRFVTCRGACFALAFLAASALGRTVRADESPSQTSAAAVEFFETKIRPVLVRHCYECHSADARTIQGGLRLDSREAARRGGDSGPAVVPGDVAASLLVDAVKYDRLEMPPSGKLPPHVIADLEQWVRTGAADPRAAAPQAPEPTTGQTDAASADGIDWAAARIHWAFVPPRRPALPPPASAASASASPPVSPPSRRLDVFVRSRLEREGLASAGEADRRVLVRRLSFDALGLPPSPEEIAAFETDASPDSYERLVDRLLAAPQHGERSARLWLDLARYGEDQAHIVGDDRSLCYPNAYLYRDWVIAAFNADVPYDEFITLQLAADRTTPDNPADDVALGFLGLGPKYYNRGSLEVMAEEWDDRIDAVTRGLVGLTVACARCHDHKFDPVAMEDYYALAGVFASTQMYNRPLDEQAEKSKSGEAKNPERAAHIVRDDSPRDLNVFLRGDVKSKGPVVRRRFLEVLAGGEPKPFENGSGRVELARAIVDPANPLTARVIVNRLWAQAFGRPLVATPSNFGMHGESPTHADVLDELAVRLATDGWSLKSLHRELFTSATYRQTSHAGAAAQARDPANVLLSHANRRRLAVESWRDALLSAAGVLETRIGGPSIDPDNPDERRRTIYTRASRLELNKLLAMFDYPDPNAHSERRVETTTPLQKLFVMNGPLVVASAERFAARLAREAPADAAERIDRAYKLLYGRGATDAERRLGADFVAATGGNAAAWSQYAQVLLAANETLFLD